MKLENQVITIEQAHKLEELGVNAPSAFYWRYPTNKWIVEPKGYFHEEEEGVEWLPAYTVAELGVMVPNMVLLGYKADDFFDEYMKDVPDNEREGKFWSLLFTPEFLAGLLIWLLENNHTTPEEVNNRLTK